MCAGVLMPHTSVCTHNLHPAQAECQFPADKEMILATVERQHGSAELFNTTLKLQVGVERMIVWRRVGCGAGCGTVSGS